MTEFVSEVKTILHSNADIYRVLSDMGKLNLVKDQIPVSYTHLDVYKRQWQLCVLSVSIVHWTSEKN